VALSPPELPGKPVLGLQLTRRDFVVFTSGAGAGAVATFLGWLIAHLLRRALGPSPERDEPEDPGKKETNP
jgi:hypothetical protein